MKAIVYHSYGSPDVLKYEDVEKPTPRDDQVLIKVRAASVNLADYARLKGVPFLIRLVYPRARADGILRPKDPRLGRDVAGDVEAVGRNITHFKPGDAVFGWCSGAFAEYVCASESALVIKSDNVTFEQAAAVPVAALTALQGLRDKGQIQPGQKVLINGASGGVGTFAVQIAKAFGAEVTAVCSTRNLDTARSIGADHVIDYTHEDFTRTGQRYDLILTVNGYHPLGAYRHALTPKGTYIMAGGSNARIAQAVLEVTLLGSLISKQGKQKMGFMGITKINQQDLVFVKELLETGKVVSIIDRKYPLNETIAAFRYFEEGHARGKVVITLSLTPKE
ncbi:MAG TPA: NAD(P)-dependent alcohol dehydrogenase [Anaerolineales bacterium]|nr:NAD(P)-dependent alcohol dehydrogenase [Anaerolineales bacterium]